jgi:hypothetical protein
MTAMARQDSAAAPAGQSIDFKDGTARNHTVKIITTQTGVDLFYSQGHYA